MEFFNPIEKIIKNADKKALIGEFRDPTLNPVIIIKNKLESIKFKKQVIKDKENISSKNENQPIRAVIIGSKNMDNYSHEMIDLIKKNGEKIDFYAEEKELIDKNIKNAGKDTYVISDFNDKDKYSQLYKDCTGVIIIGKDKETGKQISVMTHQNPKMFLENYRQEFERDFSQKAKEIYDKVDKNTIDVVIFGGKVSAEPSDIIGYKKSIQFLDALIKKEIHKEPIVITGPNSQANMSGGPTNSYFDTQNRRLFITRPGHKSEMNESYYPSNLEEKSKDWSKI